MPIRIAILYYTIVLLYIREHNISSSDQKCITHKYNQTVQCLFDKISLRQYLNYILLAFIKYTHNQSNHILLYLWVRSVPSMLSMNSFVLIPIVSDFSYYFKSCAQMSQLIQHKPQPILFSSVFIDHRIYSKLS